MADFKGTPGGEGGRSSSYYHDGGDGTADEAFGAHLRGWDTTDGAWYRLPVDHATGALKVAATLSAGALDIGTVDQGTGGSSAWKVTGATPVEAAHPGAQVRIQIVDSETGELVATKQGLNLEAAIPAHTTLPRRRLRARRRRKVLLEDLAAILAGLRDETRKV